MSHNINTYIGRLAAWHALGQVTGKFMTSEELLADPGFQFVVFKSQLHDGLGRPVQAWGTFRWNIADKLAGLKDKAEFLGAVGKDYGVIQHAEGFKSIDAVIRSADGAHYETAGVLGNGERVWALADLGHAIKVGEDVQKGYLLFSTGHDGSMGHTYRLCFERVVCQNTLTIALGEKTKAQLSIRHTKNAAAKLADARATLEAIGNDVAQVEDRLNFLAGRKLNREATMTILDRLFPKNEEARSDSRRQNILSDVLKIYELNDGNAYPEQRGTAYNLLQAVTNYTDHERSSKEDGRAESAMFGSGDALKTKAYSVIYDVARKLDSAAPIRETVPVDFAALGLNVR